jgi:hypothetical protein
LLRDPLDQALARALLSVLGESAREPLLDALRDAGGRTARRLILARLREFGPALVPALMARTHGAPWYFTRNLLALVREVTGTTVEHAMNVDAAHATELLRLIEHEHDQVRLEAVRILLSEPTLRDVAMRRALNDTADRVVLAALDLLASLEQPARALLPEVIKRLVHIAETESQSVDARTRALRLLAYAPTSPRIRDMLIATATERTRILRRVVLAQVSNVMVVALEVLATRYAGDEQAAAVLEIAPRSDDKRVRDAVARVPSLATRAR